MASESPGFLGQAVNCDDLINTEQEPRLKYEALGQQGSVPSILAQQAATRLCVSDKVLALGTVDGSVHVLDYDGNEIKRLKEHGGPVTDLCFDVGAEYLASCAADGSLAIYGLYSEEKQTFKYKEPLRCVALEPRYATRKTREFIYGTASGTLALSSKGWLGNTETVLFQGKGPVRALRMSGSLLAWATDTGIRVYDTTTHTRVGKLERPPSAAAAAAGSGPAADCSLFWVGERELYIGWARRVMVVRVLHSPALAGQGAAAAPTRSLQILASFDADYNVAGVAPFGVDLAVLAWSERPASSSGGAARHAGPAAADGGAADGAAASASAGTADSSHPRQEQAEQQAAAVGSQAEEAVASAPQICLKIVHRSGEELASDTVNIPGIPPARAATSSSGGVGSEQLQQQQQQQPCCLEVFYSPSGPTPGSAFAPQRPAVSMSSSSSPARQALSSGQSTPQAEAAVGSRRAADTVAAAAAAVAAVSPVSSSGGGGGAASPSQTPPPPAAEGSSISSQWGLPVASRAATLSTGSVQGGTPGPQQQQQQLQRYKWWRDGEEPLYYVVTARGIVVGRPRDGNDRVAWLTERKRFAEALDVAETDLTVKPGVAAAIGQQYLSYLLDHRRYQEAAALAPRVLNRSTTSSSSSSSSNNGNADLSPLPWERLVYKFAQARQLAALAPHLPTQQPRLQAKSYDMVLNSFLLAPSDHPQLLETVRRWPTELYSLAALQEAVASRMTAPGGDSPALLRAAALLHTQAGQYREALRLLLRLRDPGVFDYIAQHGLMADLAPAAAELIMLDEVRATSLLVAHADEAAPAEVVAALQRAAEAAAGVRGLGGEQLQVEREQEQEDGYHCWRLRLHHYLDWLFQKDPALSAEFASLQVELYAQFDPARLLNFLMVSSSYPLEQAYQVCEGKGLIREMVYVLGRMGAAERALRLMVEGLRDVGQAVEFVSLQRDDELWELLITLALADAQLTGSLLDHAGGYVDPLRVVSRIPAGMRVEGLRQRLVKIITDFRAQMSLQQGCNTILRHDCVALAGRLHKLLRQALSRMHLRQQDRWVLFDAASGREVAEEASQVPGPLAASSSSTTSSPQSAHGSRVWFGTVGSPAPRQKERGRQRTPAQSPSSIGKQRPAVTVV